MKTQWQNYKQLELIPDSMPEPDETKRTFSSRFKEGWRHFINSLTGGSDEEPYEYLERCLELDASKLYIPKETGIWHKFWSFFDCQSSDFSEPEVWRSLDKVGNTWWHVYDPMTGRTADLESEEAVQVWLEEHYR